MHVEEPPLSVSDIEAIARQITRPVVLVGMMGVGKSSVGKRLAVLLRCPFADADEEIETSARRTIPEIFDGFGEAYFRDGERRVIARLVQQFGRRGVIATGGGAFCNDETRGLLLAQTVPVWLDSDVDTLVERTARRDNRPLLRHGDPRETLSRLREERRCHYEQAPIHVLSGPVPHERTVHRVLRGLHEWL